MNSIAAAPWMLSSDGAVGAPSGDEVWPDWAWRDYYAEGLKAFEVRVHSAV